MYSYLASIGSLLRSDVDVQDFADSLSTTQYTSKKWLVDVLVKVNPFVNPTVLIVGGWYGSYLIPMLEEGISPHLITHTDINPHTSDIAKHLHGSRSRCTFHVLDADNPEETFKADILINTSCEHMHTIGESAVHSPGCLYVLQSCDNPNDPGHINVPTSTDQFVVSTGLTHILFRGRLNLGHKNRFMVIGYK